MNCLEKVAYKVFCSRKSWDTFLVSPNNEMGSKIPIGWVLPDIHSSEQWAKYLGPV